jgi:hypothetical protein
MAHLLTLFFLSCTRTLGSLRGVPKLLSQDQMDKRAETSDKFVKMVQDKGRSILAKSSLWMSRRCLFTCRSQSFSPGSGPLRPKSPGAAQSQWCSPSLTTRGRFTRTTCQGCQHERGLYHRCPEEVLESSSSEKA